MAHTPDWHNSPSIPNKSVTHSISFHKNSNFPFYIRTTLRTRIESRTTRRTQLDVTTRFENNICLIFTIFACRLRTKTSVNPFLPYSPHQSSLKSEMRKLHQFKACNTHTHTLLVSRRNNRQSPVISIVVVSEKLRFISKRAIAVEDETRGDIN
jgi:hypothetical protein